MTKWKDPAVRGKARQRKRHTPRACQTGKVRYRDRAEAMAALRVVQGDPRRPQKRVYECPFCKGWHMTSREEWAA